MNVSLEDAGFRRENSIEKISSKPIVTIYEDNTIEQAASRILDLHVRRLPVVDKNKKLVGIITILDILSAIARGDGSRTQVKTIMTKNVVACSSFDTIETALDKMKMSKRGGIPIIDNQKAVGIITEKDIAKNFDNIKFRKTLEEIMIRKPLVMKVSQTAYDALKLMSSSRMRSFPVVDGETVSGIITARDILTILAKNNFRTEFLKVPVASVMRTLVFKLRKEADVSEAVKLMNAADVSGVVITDNNYKLQGIVTYRDVLNLIN